MRWRERTTGESSLASFSGAAQAVSVGNNNRIRLIVTSRLEAPGWTADPANVVATSGKRVHGWTGRRRRDKTLPCLPVYPFTRLPGFKEPKLSTQFQNGLVQ